MKNSKAIILLSLTLSSLASDAVSPLSGGSNPVSNLLISERATGDNFHEFKSVDKVLLESGSGLELSSDISNLLSGDHSLLKHELSEGNGKLPTLPNVSVNEVPLMPFVSSLQGAGGNLKTDKEANNYASKGHGSHRSCDECVCFRCEEVSHNKVQWDEVWLALLPNFIGLAIGTVGVCLYAKWSQPSETLEERQFNQWYLDQMKPRTYTDPDNK